MNGFRRTLDILLSSTGLLLLSPLYLLCALGIRVNSPRGGVIFSQPRVGLHGKTFRIFKFRTMVPNADDDELLVTGEEDDRITSFGRWLRRFKLDELPQLYNVLRGDMSLVGPRPRVEKYARHYPPELREEVLSVRPGITDPATIQAVRQEQTLGRIPREERERYYLERILPGEVAMNADYLRRRTLRSDLRVLVQTVRALLEPRRTREGKRQERDSGPALRKP